MIDKSQVNEILVAIKRRDEFSADAVEQLYNTMGGVMNSIAVGIVLNKSTAEDVVQESFIKIVNNIEKFNVDNGFGWVLTLVRNTALNKIKAEKNKQTSNVDDYYDITDTNVVDSDTKLTVMQALTKLNEKQRLIIIMKYYEDKTVREIAKVLHMPFSTVQNVVTVSEKKLRIYLEN